MGAILAAVVSLSRKEKKKLFSAEDGYLDKRCG
jgi:hypothetical protein